MRVVHGMLGAILVLFAALQYNDPDVLYWGAVYTLAAVWSFLAAAQPQLLTVWTPARLAAAISIVLFLVGFLMLVGQLGPGWIHNEEARESLGYLICAASTALAVWDARRQQARPARKAEHEAG